MHQQDNKKWQKIAESLGELQLPASGIAAWEIDGKKICLSFFKDRLFACTAKCPHAGGNIAAGYIDVQGNIVCPLHRYKFDLKNGRNTSGEGYSLKTWPVEEREDGIYIAIENNNLF